MLRTNRGNAGRPEAKIERADRQPWRSSRPLAVKAVGAFLPKLTRVAFEKYGFSAATLLTDWSAIVGKELAACSVPERLKWPRHADVLGDADAPARGRPCATLVLRVDPARALEVQYGAAQLLERVNRYFGYRAVAELRVVQGSVAARAAAPLAPSSQSTKPAPAPLDSALAAIPHEGLKAALTRMHASLAAPQT
jgi:hypothetical protein